jgi:MFS family permease
MEAPVLPYQQIDLANGGVALTRADRSSRPLVIAAVMATMTMVSVESTIVSTVMPQIVAELGGLHLYSWIFSAFLLAQTAVTVIFGKLADIYGRKSVMIAGISIFLLGSILAGFAHSMPAMIIYRLIQGVGAGATQPLAMIIVGDLYSMRERGNIQGYLSSVWAVSAVMGPLLGAFITNHLSWAWVFWINIPVGIGAIFGFYAFLQEVEKRQDRKVDFLGAVFFTIAVSSLIISLTEFGNSSASFEALAALTFCLSTAALVSTEQRVEDPMISWRLWAFRPIAVMNTIALLGGAAFMGLTTFLPLYVQLVLGSVPMIAGLALTMILLGWPVGATIAARSYSRWSLRQVFLCGTFAMPIGASLFVLLKPTSSPVLAALGSLIIGLGLGTVGVTSLVMIQQIVSSRNQGVATASNLFARNLGSTLGAAALGALWNYSLGHPSMSAPISPEQLQNLLRSPGAAVEGTYSIRAGIGQSLNLTLWAVLGMSLAAALVGLLIPSICASMSKGGRIDRPDKNGSDNVQGGL